MPRLSPLLLLLLLLPHCSRAVKVYVFTNVTSPDYTYPEISPDSQFYISSVQQKPSLGIAISGGGWRAAALGYGWLRAMHLMNITTSAQYLSTTSAGAWAAVPYAYTAAPLNRFFSPYFEPNNLTTARLSTSLTPGSWGMYAAGKTLLNGALGNPVTSLGEPTNWAINIANIFLAPFGLGSSDSSVSAEGTKGDLLQLTQKRLPQGVPVHVACKDSRPYPITVGSIVTPEREVTPKFFPFEFTPLYFGMPPAATYNKPIALGGGFVEPLGFNAQPPRRKPVSKAGTEAVDVAMSRPTGTSSLVHVVGISSSATAARMKPTNLLTANLFNGQMVNYFNLWDYKAAKLAFADGGVVDPLGVMPLLRRGVKSVIACVATRTDPTVSLQEFAEEEYGLSGLFGAFPMEAKLLHGQDDPTTWNDMQQVFPKEGFAELYRALKASHAAGDAHVFARTYEVLPNSFMGIPGGYEVNVLFVLNGRSSQWEAALPEPTLRWLDKQRNSTGPFRYYPNVHHTLEAPGPLINLLSQQASWAFRAKKAEVLEFVAGAVGSSSGPGEEVIKGNVFR